MKNPCKECVVRARCMERKMSDLIRECYLIEKYIKSSVNSQDIEKQLVQLVNDLKCSKTI